MFKKILALTLALVMLLMPMTASAVTWSEIKTALNTKGVYNENGIDATKDGEKITVTGGTVQFGYVSGVSGNEISEAGTYIFEGVTLVGDSLFIAAVNGSETKVSFDESTTLDLTDGVRVVFHGVNHGINNSEVSIHNDTTIVDFEVDYAGDSHLENNKVIVDGIGTIRADSDDEPVEIIVANAYDNDMYGSLSDEEILNLVKDGIQIQQEIVAADGKLVMNVGLYPRDIYVIDQNGALYKVIDFDRSNLELIDPNFMNDEEEEEPEPKSEAELREEQRQAEAIGGVTTSPVWNWQGYLGHSSKPMWIYVNGEKVLMRQRLLWVGDGTKNHTCRIRATEPDPASVELRVGLDMLRTAQRAEISVISILDANSNTIAQFAVSDLLGAFEQYGLVEGELLCVSGDANAEVMKVTLDGEYLPLEAE